MGGIIGKNVTGSNYLYFKICTHNLYTYTHTRTHKNTHRLVFDPVPVDLENTRLTPLEKEQRINYHNNLVIGSMELFPNFSCPHE